MIAGTSIEDEEVIARQEAQAEAERERAEKAQLEVENLKARLRSLGVDRKILDFGFLIQNPKKGYEPPDLFMDKTRKLSLYQQPSGFIHGVNPDIANLKSKIL